MAEITKNAWGFFLWSTLAGAIAFLISGILSDLWIMRFDEYIFATVIAGAIGGFLLGVLLRKRQKIWITTFAGAVAVPVGFWSAFILAGVADLLLPVFGVNTDNPSMYNIENIIAVIFMGIICGAIFGAINYGRKSIWVFTTVCGVVSIPFGLLVGAMNSGHWIKLWLENLFQVFGNIDLNFLVIILLFGVGAGLSIGVYNILQQKDPDVPLKKI